MIRNRYVYRNEAGEGGEDGGGEAVVADKAKVAGEGESGEREVSPEIIAKAEKMGWTPKDQFKGDPDKWRPADEFVERGENMLPLLRSQVKRQERQIAELSATVKDFTEHLSKTEKRAYDKALADLKEARAAAIKAGDGETFDKVDDAIADLRDKMKPKEAPQQDGAIPEKDFNEWLSRNRWAEEEEMQDIGVGIRKTLHKQHPDATPLELLDLVTKEVKRRFPEKFENPRRNTAAAVEGAAPPRKSGGKTYADLPADARAACDRMARNGYADKPKEMAEFKAAYVKSFFEEA
jgi:hypothetical protein